MWHCIQNLWGGGTWDSPQLPKMTWIIQFGPPVVVLWLEQCQFCTTSHVSDDAIIDPCIASQNLPVSLYYNSERCLSTLGCLPPPTHLAIRCVPAKLCCNQSRGHKLHIPSRYLRSAHHWCAYMLYFHSESSSRPSCHSNSTPMIFPEPVVAL